jgi:cytosine deaminase
MDFDFIFKGVNLTNGVVNMDVGVSKGTITAIDRDIQAPAGQVIEGNCRLLSAPFVDTHFHLDATLAVGNPRHNLSGTLLEGIRLWGEARVNHTREALIERAMRYCDLAVSQGLLHIRTHVDVTDERLIGAQAMLEVKDMVKDYIDLQLVAFPQDGYFRAPQNPKNMLRALDMGLDIVGGIPHQERTMDEGRRSVVELCELAAARGLMVDFHCDETDDPNSRHIETLAMETVRHGMQGRVAGSHLTSMHSMDNYYFSKLLHLMTEANIQCIANPVANIILQGRHDTYPKRRGMMRVAELWTAGLNVSFGQDSCMDYWYSMGNAEMLDVAHMAIHTGHLTSQSQIRQSYDSITSTAASVMGLEDYGIKLGSPANLVLLDAKDEIEAIRLRATRLMVMRKGMILSETAPRAAKLTLDGRPEALSHYEYAPR